MFVRLVVTIVAALICTGARSETSNSSLPCVGQICLGMTIDEVAKLNLEPANILRLSFDSKFANQVGIDTAGKRIRFSGSSLDRPIITQLQKKIKVICSSQPWSATTKAIDGRRIRLVLYPHLVEGKSKLIVVGIERAIPAVVTAAQQKEYDLQLRDKYGDLYIPFSGTFSWPDDKPSVQVVSHFSEGNVLKLSMPRNIYGPENREELMGQPGCSEKLTLD